MVLYSVSGWLGRVGDLSIVDADCSRLYWACIEFSTSLSIAAIPRSHRTVSYIADRQESRLLRTVSFYRLV